MKYFILSFSLLMLGHFPSHGQVDTIKYGLKGKIIRAFEKSSTGTLYAGLKGNTLGTGLVYKSDDHGHTWEALGGGHPIDPYVSDIQALAVSPTSSKTIFAGTWKNGLYQSEDGGATWDKVWQCPSSDIRSIRTGSQNPLLIYAATSSFGVIKSLDGGASWSRNDPQVVDSTFQFAWSIEVSPDNDDVIFAQTFSDGVWRSIDQGISWSKILDTAGKVSWDLKISETSSDIWLASSQRGDSTSAIYHSPDMGSTWQELSDVPQIGINQINAIKYKGSHALVVGSWQDGVYMLAEDKWSKVENVDFSSIAHILPGDQSFVIGSWGNGIYHLKL